MWYSNPLAQWFDIPLTATPTHDEKGTGRVAGFPHAIRVVGECEVTPPEQRAGTGTSNLSARTPVADFRRAIRGSVR